MSVGYERPCLDLPETPELLLEAYLPLTQYHADQLMRRVPDSIERDDLINAGVLGLLDAASRFDPERGIQFSTFVGYRVRGAMIDYLRAFDWFPRSLRETAKEVQQALTRLEQVHGRPAEEAEIADALGMDLTTYRDKLLDIKGMTVLYFDDLPLAGDEDGELDVLEVIAGDPEQMPERQTAMSEFMGQLAEAIEALPLRERIILTLYYYEELSMKEVALVLNLTESRVSQLHSQMVLRLRGLLKLDLGDGHAN